MTYPKKIMKISELKKMGFSDKELRAIYRMPGQKVVYKMNPFKRNSHLVIDTEELEKYRISRARASQKQEKEASEA